ncbi:hypothetical protein CAPTEDRAFT_184984 [Capitella teleta]|uniref:THAP-type domain-containing protein n=1 Tax=Capitella teleta TaxID=283909 RepID=R7TBF1_CAPTE|nr:hypothetical protein CAPTEDRAFT_184984 [Capitella teleta]|eukprot:ELT88807.1 hypothetical protein CAPTEDRAFT_184984 [Capitella teleta]
MAVTVDDADWLVRNAYVTALVAQALGCPIHGSSIFSLDTPLHLHTSTLLHLLRNTFLGTLLFLILLKMHTVKLFDIFRDDAQEVIAPVYSKKCKTRKSPCLAEKRWAPKHGNLCVWRADLNISNVKHKFICSIHFEPQTYACPTNIAQSSLMPNATPALITCPNPSITPKRRRPRDRSTAPPAKKRKLMTPEAGSEASDDVHPMEELPPPPTPTPSPSLDMSKNFKEHDRLAQALTDMTALRSQHQAQSRKLNRLQERLEEKL